MASHSVVSTQMTMDVSDLARGVQAAVQNLDKVGDAAKKQSKAFKNLEKSLSTIKRAYVGFLGIKALAFVAVNSYKALVGSVVNLVNAQLDFVKSNFDVAYSLGLTYNQMQALTVAAKQSGLTFERIYEPMSKVSRKIDDALKGSALMIQNFQRLRLDPDQLKGLSQFDQFKTIVKAINNVGNASERAALTMNIFEESGGKFLQLFQRLGSGGFERFAKLAKELGLTLNNLQLGSLLQAQQAIENMTLALKGLKTQVVANIAPFVETIANKITAVLTNVDVKEKLKDLLAKWVETLVNAAADGIDLFVSIFGSLTDFLDKATALIDKVNQFWNFGPYTWGKQTREFIDQTRNRKFARRDEGLLTNGGGGGWGDEGDETPKTPGDQIRAAYLEALANITKAMKDLLIPKKSGAYEGPPVEAEQENTVAVKQLTRATQANTAAMQGLAQAEDVRTAGGVSTQLASRGYGYGEAKQVKLLEKIVQQLVKGNANKPIQANL